MIENSKFKFNHAESPVYIHGTGPNGLLILHGWGSKIQSWQNLIAKVNPTDFTVYFLELPGFGASISPNKAWNVDDYLSFVSNFVGTLAEAPKYLLVHSFGGRIATKWLASGKHPFEKAIFVGAAGIKPKLNPFQKFSKWIAPKLKKASKIPVIRTVYKLLKKLVYKLNGADDYLKVSGAMKKTFVNVIEEDLTDLLSKIKIPVRLIWGKYDSYTPLWMGELMHKKIKNSELVVLPEGRHGLHLQNTDVLVHNLQEYFLSE